MQYRKTVTNRAVSSSLIVTSVPNLLGRVVHEKVQYRYDDVCAIEFHFLLVYPHTRSGMFLCDASVS